ncbi:hypothetical protein JNK62_02625 [bacterium]|nr:hypothetical protein [bacterium]
MKNNLYIDGVHYLTAREAGDVLGYAPDYVSRLCREGKLRGRRSGKTWIVEADSLVPFIKAHEAKKEAWHQNLSRELKSVAEPVVVRDENFQPLSPVHVAPRQLHILRASEKAHAAREKAQTMLITRITISSICAVLLLFIANTTALSTPIANMLRGSAAEQVAAASFFSPIESIARASYTSITSIACSITGWCDDVQPMPVVYVRGGSQPVAQAPAPTQITNNITNYIQPTVGSGGVLASGLSEQLLDSRLNAMENYLTGRIELAEYRGDRQAESIVDSFPDGIGGAGFDDIDITDSTFTGGSISGASISGSTLSGITFSGTQAFDGLEVTDATSTNATSTNMYVSGSFGFGTGTGLLQTSDGIASTLTNGSNGQVLKMVSGNLTWSTDLTGGGGGGASFFASTTDDLAIYPADPTDVVIIGSSATTTVGTILEIAGNSLFRGAMTSYGNVTAPRFTATSSAASVFPYASTTALSTNSLCISGDCRQAWPTFTDTSFSTTSADYWKTQRDFFSTTSASYFLAQNQGNAFSTTSADAWKDQRNFFSTTSASYFSSIGLAFSTTSNDYWKSVNNFFSTTSATYFVHSSTTIPKTYTANTYTGLQTFSNASTTLFSSTYASSTVGYFGSLNLGAALSVPNGGTGSTTLTGLLKGNGTGAVLTAVPGTDYIATTAGDWTGTFDGLEGSYYLANSFSTTSANYWSSLGLGFSTTSANYWQTTRDFFSTTSAIYLAHSSTTIPKTYSANTFTALQTFANASSTLFSSSYASSTNAFFGSTTVSGNVTARDYLFSETSASAQKRFSVTRAVPTTINDTISIASTTITNGAHNLYISITVPASSFSVSKQYALPLKYAQTSGAWQLALPISDTGSYVGNDFALDVRITNQVADFRIRRTLGSTVGTATINIEQLGAASTFTFSSFTESVSAPTAALGSTAFTQANGVASTSALVVSGQTTLSGNLSGVLKAANGVVSVATPGTDYQNFAYPFPSNATSTLLGFNGGLTAYASSTIGDGTQTGGLTISGGATTTGSLYVASNVGIGVASPSGKLEIGGTEGADEARLIFGASDGSNRYTFETDLDSSTSNDFLGLRTASTDNTFVVRGNGNVGISTSTPGSLFSIGNTNGINFSTATSTFSSTGGINLSGGCYAINGTCIGGGSASLSGTQGQLAYFSGTNTAIGTSSLFIDTNGRVGVGTTTPVAKFNVWGDMEIGAGGTTNLRAYNSSRNANGFLTLYDGTNGNVAIGTTFGTGDVILSPGTNGFVGIGTTTPIAALTVFGDTLFNGTDRYANFGTTTGSSGYGFRDNGGVIEFKNAGGTWQGVTTATTGPSFSVHKNGSDQTIAAGGATLLTWSTETFDTNNNFASNRFTPTVPGKYLIRAQAWWANTIDAGGNASIMIYKNGAVVAQVYNYPDVAAAQRLTSSISEIIDMNGSTDYVEIYVSHATAGSEVVDGTAILTNFSGAMIAPVNGNNAAGWANDGTQSFLLDNADKVGIGTTTPWAKLALQGDAGQTNPVFEIASSSTATKFLSVSGTGFGTTTLSGLNISGSATSTSNVGMNITSGCYAVNGTCVGGGSASLTGTTGQVAYFSGTNTAIGTSSLFIATNGNIGIGTTTPVACTGCSARSLAIEGDNASLRLNDTTGTAGDWLAFANNGSFTLSDNRAKSTRLLVNSNGDMGLGTSTPNAKLTVFGDTLFNGTDRYTNFGTTTGTDGYGFRDNGGVIEFKNAGGTWQGVTTATTGPSFHVSKTADQTNVGASPTLITWDVESFDTNNNFSGNRFMPTVPGKYILTANLQYGALSADDHGFAMIYKNGVAAANAILPSETAEASTVNVVITTIVEANGTTDYFEVYGDTQTASNQIVDGGNTAITYFTGAMIAPVNGNNAAGWANDGTQSFLLDNADKVGIGTTTPWAKLALQGDAGQTNPVFEIASSSTATKFLSVSATGFGTTTLSGLNISGSATSTSNVGMNITSGCYAVGGVCLSSGSSFAYPFLLNGNATSTLTQFNGGLTAYASSTIGAGGQATGLTINGGATTTGNAYFGGNVGIGTTSPGSVFSIGSIANFQAGTSTLYQNLNVQGQLKVGTNSIYLNGSGTSTFSNGIDLAGGCFSILNTCVLSANTSGLVAGDLTTAINTSVNALQIASSSAKWVSLSNGVADSFGSASIADDSGIDLVNSSGIATSAGMIALVPDAAPSGGSSSSSGGDSIRTFTSNGTFYSGAVGTVQVLVVGGGGGGGGNATASVRGSGGGGAGEYVAISSFNVTPATSYAITVGTGGGSNTDGATTTAFGLTARGGGAGAEPFNNGRPGGSGGGAGDDSSATTGGASTAVSPGVGSSGGNAGSGGSGGGGAGGGGAAGAGGSGGGNGVEAGGAGGTGIANTISGTSVTYSSGGAGGTRSGNNNGTNGATPGSGGRGAGGGASTVVTGGTGADGIVIVRYTTVSGTGASRLISNTFTASSSPSTAKFFFAGTSTAAFTLNTHIAAAVSRDGGTTWSTTTLQALSTLEDGSTLYGDTAVDLSGQPSGTSMKYRILMSPSSPAGIMLRGVSLQWGEVSAQNAGALSVTGSLSAQSLSLTSALGVANGGTGLTSISSGSILFGNDTGSIGTSSSLFWDTTNQRLGIGTTTPTYMLSVSGNGTNAKNRIAVWGRQNTTNGTAAGLSFFNTDGNPSTQKEIAGIDAGRHSNNFGGSLSLFTSDTAGATSTRLFIDSSGNVGIGTTTPLRQLHVSGTNAYVRLDGSANSGMEIYESGARKWIIDNLVSDDRLRFFSDTANEIMSLTQSGNVGVGTTTPVSTLSVQGSLCVRSTGSCGTTAGTIYATTATISDIDLAENYRAIDSTLLTGEIVSLLENSTSTIRRAKHGEEGLGVLSTKPGLLLGQEIKDGRAVALKGRVPLKVNMEGGPIAVGDRLTISSVPGIGTKATTSSYTVARALEATSVSGEIEVFVENEYTLVIEEKNALRDLLNATSTATSTPVFANIFARMTNWLADAQNGITEIFTKTLRAENVYADTVNANKLCLEDLCVTKAELQQLLNQSGATPASTPEEPPDEPQSETPPEETGSEEPAPEPEDSPETEAPEDAPEESETPPNDENPEPESTPEPSPEEV